MNGLLTAVVLLAATFHRDPCGITFEYPDSWLAGNGSRGAFMFYKDKDVTCRIGIRPPGWVHEQRTSNLVLSDFAVNLIVFRRPFRATAHAAGFTQMGEWRSREMAEVPLNLQGLADDDWAIGVRQGDEPAMQFQTQCCQAVRGSTWGNGRAKDGSKTTETSDIAVLNDRKGHSVIIWSDNDERFHDVVTQVIYTLRFQP